MSFPHLYPSQSSQSCKVQKDVAMCTYWCTLSVYNNLLPSLSTVDYALQDQTQGSEIGNG